MLNSFEKEDNKDLINLLINLVFFKLFLSAISLYKTKSKYSAIVFNLSLFSFSLITSGKPPNSKYSFIKLSNMDFSLELNIFTSNFKFLILIKSLNENGSIK